MLCFPPDPTLSFSGLDTWSRNINNLKIFFRDPRLELREIRLDTYVILMDAWSRCWGHAFVPSHRAHALLSIPALPRR